MIGALLSNTPAAILRNNGVAGVDAPGSGETSQDRDSGRARDSLASARAVNLRTDTGPVLTPQAVVALQESEDAAQSRSRRAGADDLDARQQTDPENPQGEGSETETYAAKASETGAQKSPGDQANSDGKDDADGDGLNEAEEKQVQELKKRDREVRAHEQAHARAGGSYASAPSYTFQQGPDGKRYAVGGEVQIDTSTERTAEATIRKMRIVINAALAPAEPSSQDLKVAQHARSQMAEAQAELRQEKAEEFRGEDDEKAASVLEPPSDNPAKPDDGSASDGAGEGSGKEAGSGTSARAAEDDGSARTGSSSEDRQQLINAISAYQSANQSTADDLFAAILATA